MTAAPTRSELANDAQLAKPGELDRVATYFPYIGQRIDGLHAEIKQKFPWQWDEEPPEPPKHEKALRKILKQGQSVMPFMPTAPQQVAMRKDLSGELHAFIELTKWSDA